MVGRVGRLSTYLAGVWLAAGVGQAAWSEPPTDACALLTQAQVSATLGLPVGPGWGLVQHVCSWHVPGTEKGATLIIYSPKRFSLLKQNTVGYGAPKTPLDGVGDEALFGLVRDFAGTLLVRKQNFVYMVRVEGLPFNEDGSVPRQVEEMEKTLAQLVLSKL